MEAARLHPGLNLLEALRVRSACHTASGEHLAAIRTAPGGRPRLAELGIRSPGVVATTWHTLSMRLLNAGRAGPAAAASDRAEIHARLAIDSAAAERGDIGGAYHLLGLVSLGRAQALIDADRPEEALDPAMRAVTIIREHAVQSPDGHGVARPGHPHRRPRTGCPARDRRRARSAGGRCARRRCRGAACRRA